MKKILVFLIGVLIASLTYASANKTNVEIKFETGLGIPNYLVSIQNVRIGNKTVPLILDTGMGTAEVLLYRNSAINSKQLIFTHNMVHGVNVRGQDDHQIVIIPELKIGSFTINHVRGIILPGTIKDHVPKFYFDYMNKTKALKNGVIGLALLQRFNVFLDYPHKKVVLYKLGVHPNINLEGWTRIPFSTKNGFIETDVIIDEVQIRLAWDTGYAPSKIKPFSQFKNSIEKCPMSYDIFGKNLSCYVSKRISISNTRLPNLIFLYKDLDLPDFVPIDGFIGSNFFYNHTVFFDFKNNVLYIYRFK